MGRTSELTLALLSLGVGLDFSFEPQWKRLIRDAKNPFLDALLEGFSSQS